MSKQEKGKNLSRFSYIALKKILRLLNSLSIRSEKLISKIDKF